MDLKWTKNTNIDQKGQKYNVNMTKIDNKIDIKWDKNISRN